MNLAKLAPQTKSNLARISEMSPRLLVPYALRRVPSEQLYALGALPGSLQSGDVAIARLDKIGKNTKFELVTGRAAALHEGDHLAVVFGNRYATEQFEGYAGSEGDRCDLLSMGGLCGLVSSRHAGVPEPSKLALLGSVLDQTGKPLNLRSFKLPLTRYSTKPRVTGVCGSSMDAGKTHTAMSLIVGYARRKIQAAGIKLTGTATGRDTWSFHDAGASPALDFIDGGWQSTYMCELDQLLELHNLLLAHAAGEGTSEVVIEIADGLLQRETAMLLQSPEFMRTVDQVVFATGDPIAAAGGVALLRKWRIEPVAISGLVSLSPLAAQEASSTTGVRCLSSLDLQAGMLIVIAADSFNRSCADGNSGRNIYR